MKHKGTLRELVVVVAAGLVIGALLLVAAIYALHAIWEKAA